MSIEFRPKASFNTQASVVLMSEEQIKGKNFRFQNKKLADNITAIVSGKQFLGEDGQIFPIFMGKNLVLLVGVGKLEKISLTQFRITLRRALLSSYAAKTSSVEIVLPEDSEPIVQSVIEASIIGLYKWDKYKTSEKEQAKAKVIHIVAARKPVYEQAIKICANVNFARNLINENADVKNSEFLEKTIRGIVKGKKNVKIEVLNEKEMKKKGLNLHLAVNKGSPYEPKLIVVKYTAGAKSDYTALVGKGITFDTGGINIKPTGHIETMRTDMSGAAAVIGTLKTTIDLNLKKNVIFAVAIAENAIGSGSFKPGDVFRSYSGKTVEILNTDAEGRLVLGDAISYVVKNYKPAKLIDIATLTGACVVALGHDYCGLLTDDDKLSKQIVHSSNETDDRVWRLPVYPELKNSVKSKIADICNIGFPRGAAGSLTAAEFLRQFATGTRWAHLDIAGTAFIDGEGRMYYGHGATGFGVRLLTHFLMHN